MRNPFLNPFPEQDEARRSIWAMLVSRDIEAFLTADWSMVEDDFIPLGFLGINANKAHDPNEWSLAFPTIEHYRDEWLRQAREFAEVEFAEDVRQAIHDATRLEEIEIKDSTALVRKKFNGGIMRTNGNFDVMQWQTLYYCRLQNDRWKISGFTGYLPYPLTEA